MENGKRIATLDKLFRDYEGLAATASQIADEIEVELEWEWGIVGIQQLQEWAKALRKAVI